MTLKTFRGIALATALSGCAAGASDDGSSASGGIPSSGGGGQGGSGQGGLGGASSTTASSTGTFGAGATSATTTSQSSASTTGSGGSGGAGGVGGAGGAEPVGEQNCANGIDDDSDGDLDCADLDCAAAPTCEELCSNSIDDDGDNLVDCVDPGCNGLGCSTTGRLCSSGACVCPTGTIESSCTNGTDDDCDGAVDCADSECGALPACAAYSQLVFSEYVEGNSNRKALELFNAGTLPVDLVACSIRRYSNASTTPSAVYKPTTTSLVVAPGATFVVCNPQGLLSVDALGIPDGVCTKTSGLITHTGNDSYDLLCNGQVIDFIGAFGGTDFAPNQTLRRSCSVTTGVPTSTTTFDPTQWGAPLPVDTFDGLGARSCPASP
jgi:hypothetical protein